MALVIGVLLVAVAALLDPLMIRLAATRRFHDGTFVAFAKPQMIEISPAGVRYSGGAGEGLTPWSSIVAVEAGRTAVYLFVNSLYAYIVPRRAFAHAVAFDTFLARACAFREEAERDAPALPQG